MNDVDLLAMFDAQIDKTEKESSGGQRSTFDSGENYEYPVCQMTWAVPGSFIGKWVFDENHLPVRIIKNVKEIKYPSVDKATGEVKSKFGRFAPITEFKIELSNEQRDLYNEILKLVDIYEGCCGNDGFVKTKATMNIFFMAIKNFTNPSDPKAEIKSYNPTVITTMIHTSSRFISSFKDGMGQYSNKLRIRGKDPNNWKLDYLINRIPGPTNLFTSITTTRPEGQAGFTTSFDFFESPESINITQEMLDAKLDLNTEIFNNQVFDTEYYKTVRDELAELTDDKGFKINKI